MIGDRDEAQECVQEAYRPGLVAPAQAGPAAHPEAWVRTVAYRLAVSRWRRTVRGRRAPDRALSGSGVTAPPSDSHVAVVEALKRLPEAQRRVLVLHHLADLSVHEVAREVGAPEGTVKARLSRGRTALAALLAEPVDEGVTHA